MKDTRKWQAPAAADKQGNHYQQPTENKTTHITENTHIAISSMAIHTLLEHATETTNYRQHTSPETKHTQTHTPTYTTATTTAATTTATAIVTATTAAAGAAEATASPDF